jgi:lactoylglutathione lyase
MRISGFLLLLAPLVAAPPARPPITGVAHIALYSHDVGKSRAFYKDFLGYAEPFSLKNAAGGVSLTFFKINDRQYIELLPETEAGGDRLSHFALETTNAEALRVYLASKGVATPPRVSEGRIGNLGFTIKDPDGHLIEIVQYGTGGWTVEEEGKSLGAQRVSTHMAHIGILVGALGPAMKFYRDTLGFRETWRGSEDGKQLSWVSMQTPDGPDAIEFMLYKDLPAPGARGGANHLCLEAPDVAQAIDALEEKPAAGVYKRPMEPRIGKNHKRQVNLFDPDGTRVELMEPATVDGAPPPSSAAPPPR